MHVRVLEFDVDTRKIALMEKEKDQNKIIIIIKRKQMKTSPLTTKEITNFQSQYATMKR